MNHATRVYDSVLELLPNEDNPTPLVRVKQDAEERGYELFAKLEWHNPFGSVKDRAASYLLKLLLEQEQLSEERGIVEPTSGNTGLSLAAMCAAHGIPMRAVVPNKVPLEKKILLKLCGAELDVVNDDLCPSPGMGDGSINLAKTYAKAQSNKWVMPNQYENEQNVQAHIETTGPEIWKQTEGRITHLFTSLGTCGTVSGCSRFLKSKNPNIKVIAVQPTEGHDVPGLRNLSQLEVSKLFDPDLIDDILELDFEHAYTRAYELSTQHGLLAGPSSGLIYDGALHVIQQTANDNGSTQPGLGVMMFCDNVFKYISSMTKHLPHLTEGTTAGNKPASV